MKYSCTSRWLDKGMSSLSHSKNTWRVDENPGTSSWTSTIVRVRVGLRPWVRVRLRAAPRDDLSFFGCCCRFSFSVFQLST